MIYILSMISVICCFVFLCKWAYAEGNIDNIIHYLGINYPDALKGMRADYIIKLGHAPKFINSNKSNNDNIYKKTEAEFMCDHCISENCDNCFYNEV